MANESPLIHDGAQCILGFDARNSTFSGSTWPGPSGSGQFCPVALSTVAAARTAVQASSGGRIYGVLQNKGSSSQVADIGIFGITKAVCAGSSIAFGQLLMVSTGGAAGSTAGTGFCAYSSAANTFPVGQALEAATVGQVFTMALYGFGTGCQQI